MDNYSRLIKSRPLNAAATSAGAPATPKRKFLRIRASRREGLVFDLDLSARWREQIRRAGLFAGGLLLMAVGTWGEFTSVRTIYWQELSKNWPQVPGTITRVERHEAHNVPYTSLRYRYQINGYRHEGETQDLPHYDRFQLEGMLKRREAISVRYNPEDPRVSVFDPGLSLFRVFMLFSSMFCLLCGMVCLRGWDPFLRRPRILESPTVQDPRPGSPP